MSDKITAAAIELYNARTERVAAHKAHKTYREEHGSCHEADEGRKSPCYTGGEPDEWCEACAGSIPTWQARVKAATRVAAALRKLMTLCRKSTTTRSES
jgi:hypothetical protein